jgi:hypothetical protein
VDRSGYLQPGLIMPHVLHRLVAAPTAGHQPLPSVVRTPRNCVGTRFAL